MDDNDQQTTSLRSLDLTGPGSDFPRQGAARDFHCACKAPVRISVRRRSVSFRYRTITYYLAGVIWSFAKSGRVVGEYNRQ